MSGPPTALLTDLWHGPAGWWWGTALLGGVLALDETAVAQTWLSQPLPAGLLAGMLTGDPVTGLVLGATVQLLVLGDLPIGETNLRDRLSPLLGAVLACRLAGWQLVFPWDAPDQAWRLGWLLPSLAAGALLGRYILGAERELHGRWMLAALRSVRRGDERIVSRTHLGCLAVTAARGALLPVAWAVLLLVLWLGPGGRLSPPVRAAAGLLAWWPPAVAGGALLDLYGTRAGRPVLAVGVLLGLALWWGGGR